MRWVPQAAIRPHRCAAVPFVGNSNARGGFIDTGHDLPGWDPHVYLSVIAVEHMAKMIGWHSPGQVNQLQATATRQQAEIDRLTAELEQANQELDAVHVLKRGGFGTSRKPGRPAAQSKEKVAS